MNSCTSRHIAFAVTMILQTAAALYAGPLNPPLGPVAPTGKTLTEVEPRVAINATNTPGDADSLFKITQAGSYYLTGNITGVAGKHGIEVAAPDVSIDLMGFSLIGVIGALDGVNVPPPVSPSSFSLSHGTVRDWGSDGVELNGVSATLTDLQLISNDNNGVVTDANTTTTLLRCTAAFNWTFGFRLLGVSQVQSCVAMNTNGTGFRIEQSGSSLSDCVANENLGAGIVTVSGCTMIACTAKGSGSVGIATGSRSTLTDCFAIGNGADGMVVGTAGVLTNCFATVNASRGFVGQADCSFFSCKADLNTGNGIDTGDGSTILDCSVTTNDADGIRAGSGVSIKRCSARGNGVNGIQAAGRTQLNDNNCSENGRLTATGAGILVSGNDGRIDGNHLTLNDFGLRITGAGNFVTRNTCQGNPANNFSIVLNNRVGQIAAPPFSAAINGNTGGSGVGSADPNANYAY